MVLLFVNLFLKLYLHLKTKAVYFRNVVSEWVGLSGDGKVLIHIADAPHVTPLSKDYVIHFVCLLSVVTL